MRKSILLVMSIIAIISCRDVKDENQPPTPPGDTVVRQQPLVNPKEQPVNKTISDQEGVVVDESKKITPSIQPGLEKNRVVDNTSSETFVRNEPELKQFMASLNEKKQVFTVGPGKITTIKAEKGTELKINSSDLVTADGKTVTSDISVVIKEYSSKLDMLKANSQTTSNGNLLVSGGTYYIEMTSNGEPLRLKEGKMLEANFPGMKEPGMELFYGIRDKNDAMNWVKPATAKLAEVNEKAPLIKTEFIKESGMRKSVRLVIKRNELQYFVIVSLTNTSINWKKFDISPTAREWLKEEIKNAKLSYDFYVGCERIYDFKFFSTKCEIYLDGDVLENGSANLDMDEFKALRNQIDSSYYARGIRLRQQRFANELVANSGLKRFGWINCDRFYGDSSIKKDFMVTLKYPTELTATTASVFMVFKNINSLMTGSYESPSVYSFSNVPSQTEVALVAITKVNGKIIVGKTSYLKMNELSNYEIRLKEISQKELDPFINSL
jgi:hypothetical protein